MDKKSIIEHIKQNDQILSLPQTLSEILTEVGKEDFSPDSLSRIILKDPSLTGKILQLANSSFYHQLGQIKTVQQAVSILGMTTVKCMALSTSVLHPDKIAAESGVDPKSFFIYVLSIAAASEQLSKCMGHQASEEAFVAGLLSDIGVLYFLHHYPKEYSVVVGGKTSGTNLIEAEREVFGTDHVEIGLLLATTWGLPDYVLLAIGGHHDISEIREDHPLTNAVRLAVQLTADGFSGFTRPIEQRLEDVNRIVDDFDVSREKVDEVSMSMLPKTAEIAEFVGVDIGNVEELLGRANQEIWKSYLTIDRLFKERKELTRKLLEEERARGAEEAKNVAMATLSHYLNNASMAVFGRSQLIRMHLRRGQTDRILATLPTDLEVIDNAVKKIVAVLAEMKEISPIDSKRLNKLSEALNLDDRIQERMSKLDFDSALPVEMDLDMQP